jgi:hypothetical protein
MYAIIIFWIDLLDKNQKKAKSDVVKKNSATVASKPALEKCKCQVEMANISDPTELKIKFSFSFFVIKDRIFSKRKKNGTSVKVPKIADGNLTAKSVLPKIAMKIDVR